MARYTPPQISNPLPKAFNFTKPTQTNAPIPPTPKAPAPRTPDLHAGLGKGAKTVPSAIATKPVKVLVDTPPRILNRPNRIMSNPPTLAQKRTYLKQWFNR